MRHTYHEWLSHSIDQELPRDDLSQAIQSFLLTSPQWLPKGLLSYVIQTCCEQTRYQWPLHLRIHCEERWNNWSPLLPPCLWHLQKRRFQGTVIISTQWAHLQKNCIWRRVPGCSWDRNSPDYTDHSQSRYVLCLWAGRPGKAHYLYSYIGVEYPSPFNSCQTGTSNSGTWRS